MSPKDLREAFDKVEGYCLNEFETITTKLEYELNAGSSDNVDKD